MEVKNKMTNKNEEIKEAESNMQPGYFHRAAAIYEQLGMTEKANEASLKCAIDCLQNYRPAFAIKYFKKAGKEDAAERVEDICKYQGFVPKENLEMRSCAMGFCSAYVDNAVRFSKSAEVKSLVEKLKEK
jgi:hypothetical protein